MAAQQFNIQVWEQIKTSILELNKKELETRFWLLYNEMTTIPFYEQSIYWEKELNLIKTILA